MNKLEEFKEAIDQRLLTSPSELVGETIKACIFAWGEGMYTLFDSGYISIISSAGGYDGEVMLSRHADQWDDFQYLAKIGAITEEDFEEFNRIRDEQHKSFREAKERADYEKLKKKFDNK